MFGDIQVGLCIQTCSEVELFLRIIDKQISLKYPDIIFIFLNDDFNVTSIRRKS